MASVYTVQQVNNYIKNMFEQDFMLRNISIKGEVSNCKYHTSGHIYFTLKDESGIMPAIMFAGNRSGLEFQMREGQTVVVLGNISIYERDGRYRIYAKKISLEGDGLLYQNFMQLKTKLEEMGLFDPMYKKPIPPYAMKIGICTAKTGAAVRDIITVSKRRNPYVQLYLCPCLVQGDEAALDIVNGIRCLDQMGLDVIIVGRGGGSIEDLWAFNEEIVAKAIFDCSTPIISAVGHQTDTTIADFVADQRAATPSAAAELATFEYTEFEDKIQYYNQMLRYHMNVVLEQYKTKFADIEHSLLLYGPEYKVLHKRQYLVDLETKLKDRFYALFTERRHRMELYAEKLNGLSPLAKIANGFVYVSDESGNPVVSKRQLKVRDTVHMIVQDGTIDATVTNIYQDMEINDFSI